MSYFVIGYLCLFRKFNVENDLQAKVSIAFILESPLFQKRYRLHLYIGTIGFHDGKKHEVYELQIVVVQQ